MDGKAVLLKSLAVVSSLAIGGGYVAWRQSEAENANEHERIEQAKAEEELELIVGSKNPVRKMLTDEEMDDYLQKGKDFIETIPGIPEGSEEVVNEAPLLPGSKSISMPIFTKRHITKGLEIYDGHTVEVSPPLEAEEKLPKLLQGSKSALVIPVEPEPDKSE